MEALTTKELALLPAKTLREPEITALYLEHPFMEAYARHTDARVKCDPKGAIGNPAEWEMYGEMQIQFLIDKRLMPQHTLLDIGCGTGRLANYAVPYLRWRGQYVGVDISTAALCAAEQLTELAGWEHYCPEFYADMAHIEPFIWFDFIWAFSVFIHLPSDEVHRLICSAVKHMRKGSQFYFSYVDEKREERTGLKQFRHTEQLYVDAAERAGLKFEHVLDGWEGRQRIGLLTL